VGFIAFFEWAFKKTGAFLLGPITSTLKIIMEVQLIF